MSDGHEIYRSIGSIYDLCMPAFKKWAVSMNADVVVTEITPQPQTDPDEVAIIWIYAVAELVCKGEPNVRFKVIAIFSEFLDEEPDGAFEMLRSTWYEADSEQDFFPVLFVETQPRNFIAYLHKRGIGVGPYGDRINMFTPLGSVDSPAPSQAT